ncbi:MAG: AbrB/MazE/SpoVT family DNA-binding domain-containing protein [Candidatus Aenigmarchaeota archaeon]|nr:AbrB/MazE/SpoVT family DNA-binding domain-containing protein [Candidatus Aenigmarchaeota archaeon]
MVKITEEMKIGPKGQVVIPKIFRKAMGFHPGSTVVFELEDHKLLIEKPAVEADKIFESIAKSINFKGKIDPHEAYEEEMEHRWKKAERGKK